MTAIEFVEKMQDPDQVGASEYRAIHELLKDVAEGLEDDGESGLNHLNCVLGEVIGHARAIQSDIRRAKKGGPGGMSRK